MHEDHNEVTRTYENSDEDTAVQENRCSADHRNMDCEKPPKDSEGCISQENPGKDSESDTSKEIPSKDKITTCKLCYVNKIDKYKCTPFFFLHLETVAVNIYCKLRNQLAAFSILITSS